MPSRSLQSHDVVSSTVASFHDHPVHVGLAMVSSWTEDTGLSEPPTTRRTCDLHRQTVCSDASFIGEQSPMASGRRPTVNGAASTWLDYAGFTTSRSNYDVLLVDDQQQRSSPDQLTAPLYSSGPSSHCNSVSVDVQSTWTSPADDEDLESLFGGDDWWTSDQSWRWQCGSDVQETSRTPMNIVSTSTVSQQCIPLHVECLTDDSSSQCDCPGPSDIQEMTWVILLHDAHRRPLIFDSTSVSPRTTQELECRPIRNTCHVKRIFTRVTPCTAPFLTSS